MSSNTLRLRPNRRYPSIPAVTGDPSNHTEVLQALKQAVEVGKRDTSDILNSFTRVQDLVDLGLIDYTGNINSLVGADLSQIANIGDLSTAATGDFLRYDGADWVNDQLANGDITQAMVTQHQAALSIGWGQLTGVPTTVAGYGITDVYTDAQVDTLLSGYQPLDADLTAIAALSTTSYGRGFLPLADIAAARAYMDVEPGVDVQAYSAVLAAYAGGDTPSAFTLGIVDSVDAAAWRTAIGAGTSSLALANPAGGAQVDLTGANGSAGTALRSDAKLILDQGIVPTWTGVHTHAAPLVVSFTGAGLKALSAYNAGAGIQTGYEFSGAYYTYVDGTYQTFRDSTTYRTQLALTASANVYGNSTDNPTHDFFGRVLTNSYFTTSHATNPYIQFTGYGSSSYLQWSSNLLQMYTDTGTGISLLAYGAAAFETVGAAGAITSIAYGNSADYPAHTFYAADTNYFRGASPTMDWHFQTGGITRGTLRTNDSFMDFFSPNQLYLEIPSLAWLDYTTGRGVLTGSASALVYGNSTDNPSHTFYGAVQGLSTILAQGAGASGGIRLTTGDGSHTGYLEFKNSSGGYEAYIGYSGSTAGSYGGELGYVAGTHIFAGSGALLSGQYGLAVATNLTTGRLITDSTNSRVSSIHTYYDSTAQEFSAGSTSGYTSGIAVVARSSAATVGEGVHLYVRNSIVASALNNGFHAPAVVNTTSTTMVSGYAHYLTGNATLPNFSATGQWVTIINNSGSAITITKGTTTMYNTHTGSSVSSVTLAARGRMVAECAASGVTYASGDIS